MALQWWLAGFISLMNGTQVPFTQMEILCRWWALSKPWELWVQAVGLVWQAPALWIPDTAQLYWEDQAKNRESASCLQKFFLHLFLHLHVWKWSAVKLSLFFSIFSFWSLFQKFLKSYTGSGPSPLSVPHLPLSFLGQVLYSTQQCFSNSWHCRKILFEAGFSFSIFWNICISVIFVFHAVLCCLPFLLTYSGPSLTSSPCEPSDSDLQTKYLSLPIPSSSVFYGITNTLLNCESECAGRGDPGRRRYDAQR